MPAGNHEKRACQIVDEGTTGNPSGHLFLERNSGKSDRMQKVQNAKRDRCDRDPCPSRFPPAPPNDISRTTIVDGSRPPAVTAPGRCNIATKRNIMAPNSRPDHRAWRL